MGHRLHEPHDPCFFASQAEDAEAHKAKEEFFESRGLVAYDLLRRFGVLGTAGDRHLAEFVPWYLTSEENLHRWGVILTPYAWRKKNAERPTPDPEEVRKKELKSSGEASMPGEHQVREAPPVITHGRGDQSSAKWN